jgi:hypothetical protein
MSRYCGCDSLVRGFEFREFGAGSGLLSFKYSASEDDGVADGSLG